MAFEERWAHNVHCTSECWVYWNAWNIYKSVMETQVGLAKILVWVTTLPWNLCQYMHTCTSIKKHAIIFIIIRQIFISWTAHDSLYMLCSLVVKEMLKMILTHVHTHTHTHTHIHTHTHTCTRTHTHTHTDTHTTQHACTHTYTHTHRLKEKWEKKMID